MGVSSSCVGDIESHEGDLTCCYPPGALRRFACVLGVRPIDFFGAAVSEAAVSAAELVPLIHDACRGRGVSLQQFEEEVGWGLSACLDPPEALLEHISIDGLQDLCRELGIDWRRVILGL